jgi:CHAD domain-containing protein
MGMTGESTRPTTGMVLHQVLALSALNFLLNDEGTIEADNPARIEVTTGGPRRRSTETERVHQSRVALRRIRSNLRTFRLVVDPAWSTSLRAELAWYGECLGELRDLFVLRDMLSINGPLLLDEGDLEPILDIVSQSISGAQTRVAEARGGDRHARLGEQMNLLWDSPQFTDKAEKPAGKLMPTLLHRSWRDVRGAGRTAKKQPTDQNLHKLRIRSKGLRYGCETVALLAGDPARRTTQATKVLQGKLGDLHDACASVEWLEALAEDHPELARSTEGLLVVQRATAAVTRRGWKKDLKEIERRWHKWQG